MGELSLWPSVTRMERSWTRQRSLTPHTDHAYILIVHHEPRGLALSNVPLGDSVAVQTAGYPYTSPHAIATTVTVWTALLEEGPPAGLCSPANTRLICAGFSLSATSVVTGLTCGSSACGPQQWPPGKLEDKDYYRPGNDPQHLGLHSKLKGRLWLQGSALIGAQGRSPGSPGFIPYLWTWTSREGM